MDANLKAMLDEMLADVRVRAIIKRRMRTVRGQLLAMRCNGIFWIED